MSPVNDFHTWMMALWRDKNDPVLHGAFADWLDEQDVPEYTAMAEVLRLEYHVFNWLAYNVEEHHWSYHLLGDLPDGMLEVWRPHDPREDWRRSIEPNMMSVVCQLVTRP